LELASSDYLDELLEVYPVDLPPPRPLTEDQKQEIVRLHKEKRYQELLIYLITLRNHPFPIEHPYASLLRSLVKGRREKDVLLKNPKLLDRLVDLIKRLGSEGVIKGVERPKDINRGLGRAFKKWVLEHFKREPFKIVESCSELLSCSSFSAAKAVVPEPQNASSTMSPGLLAWGVLLKGNWGYPRLGLERF
jgi:hypothetical protein